MPKKEVNTEEETSVEICPECGNEMIEEDGEKFCPHCQGEIDFMGGEDDEV